MSSATHELVAQAVRRELRAGRTSAFVVWGKSMWPTIRPGTRVLFDPTAGNKLVAGDIVLADVGQHFLMHRAARRDGAGWWLRDDLSSSRETYVSDSEILGRARDVFFLGARVCRRDQAVPALPLVGMATVKLSGIRRNAAALANRWPFPRALAWLSRARAPFQSWELAGPLGADRDLVRQLWLVAGRYPQGIHDPAWRDAIVHVARSRQQTIAWARVSSDGEIEIWVASWFRGLGISDRLLSRSIDSARERGLSRLWLLPHPRSGWLERRGFTVDDEGRLVLPIG